VKATSDNKDTGSPKGHTGSPKEQTGSTQSSNQPEVRKRKNTLNDSTEPVTPLKEILPKPKMNHSDDSSTNTRTMTHSSNDDSSFNERLLQIKTQDDFKKENNHVTEVPPLLDYTRPNILI